METLATTPTKVPDFVRLSNVGKFPEIQHSQHAFRQLRHRADDYGLSELFVKRAGAVFLFVPGYFHWLKTGEVIGPVDWKEGQA